MAIAQHFVFTHGRDVFPSFLYHLSLRSTIDISTFSTHNYHSKKTILSYLRNVKCQLIKNKTKNQQKTTKLLNN